MKSLREKRLRLVATFIVFSVLAAALIGLVLADVMEWAKDTSEPAHDGYAYVEGTYVTAPQGYYKTYHYGNVSEDAAPLANTRFRGIGDNGYGWHTYYLNPGGSKSREYNPTDVDVAMTYTDPNNDDDRAEATIVAGLG